MSTISNSFPDSFSLAWVGIDVSKHQLDVYQLRTQQWSQFDNTPAGIEALSQQLKTIPALRWCVKPAAAMNGRWPGRSIKPASVSAL